MAEENKPIVEKEVSEQKKEEEKPKAEEKKEEKSVEKKPSEEKEEESEQKKEEVKKPAKPEKPTGPKKTEAVIHGRSLPISTKHSIAICNLIRGKEIDKAILILEQAENMKIAVPMRGEIPHRKGMMSGRYPVKAVGFFIRLLKSLKANAIVNELELEKYVLFCKANVASRPYKRFGQGRFKRTHVEIKLIKPIKRRKKK